MKRWLQYNASNSLNLISRPALGQIRFESVLSKRRVGRPISNRRLLTLDPAKLAALQQPALDFSEMWDPTIRVGDALTQVMYGAVNEESKTGGLPFPRGTRGFLYYHQQPDRPRISGQLRFRVTPSDDPASFPQGYDLMRPLNRLRWEKHWSIPLVCLTARKSNKHLLSQLINDGLIDQSLVKIISDLDSQRKLVQRAHYLYTLSDPWEINYSNDVGFMLRAVTESGQSVMKMVGPHRAPQSAGRMNFKSGIIRVCFEKSTLPEHYGKQIALTRCLEIVEPLVIEPPEGRQVINPIDLFTYTPVPGQLLQSLPAFRSLKTSAPRPWSIDASHESKHGAARGIRLLW